MAASTVAASAWAQDMGYCGFLVNAKTRCPEYVIGVAYHNEAQYRGSGSVSVCERVDSGSTTISRRCATTYVSDGSTLEPYHNNGILMFIAAGNNDDNRHTIYGFTRGYNLDKRCCS